MFTIYYRRLPNCPNNQLSKSHNHVLPLNKLVSTANSDELVSIDAGYDLRVSENVIVYPPTPYAQEEVTFPEYWQIKPAYTGKRPSVLYNKPDEEQYYEYHPPETHSRYQYKLQLVPTGIQVQLDQYGLFDIRPRSSTHKLGIVIANSPGTVDYSYTGELMISVYALHAPVPIPRGTAIAQLIPLQQPLTKLVPVQELEYRSRGVKGFGSTGS